MQDPAKSGRARSSSDGGRAPEESNSPGGVVNQPISFPVSPVPVLGARVSTQPNSSGGVITRPTSSSSAHRRSSESAATISGHRSLWGEAFKMDAEVGDDLLTERMSGEDLSPSRNRILFSPAPPPPPPPPPLPEDQFAPPEEDYVRANWVNFQSEICYGFGKLYETKDMADVTIACEGILLKCHKLVLGLSSQYFRRMFDSVRCKHPVVILTGIRLRDIKNVLRFVYYGYFHGTREDIENFRSTAECLQIDGVYSEVPRESYIDDEGVRHPPRPQRIVIEERPFRQSYERPHGYDEDHFQPPTHSRRTSAQLPTFPRGRNSAQPRSGSTSAHSPSDYQNRRRRSSAHFSPDDPRFDDSPPPGIRATICEDSSSQSQDFGESTGPVRRSVILRSPSSGEGSRPRVAIPEENLTAGSLTVDTSTRISSTSQPNNIYIRRPDGEITVIPSSRFSHISPSGALTGSGAPASSPASDSRLLGATRPPVLVNRRRRAASDPHDEDSERYDLNLRSNQYFAHRRSPNLLSGSGGPSRGSSHPRNYQPAWNLNSPYTATSETATSDSSRLATIDQLAMMHLEHAQRTSSLPQTVISGTATPSRLAYGRGAMETIPLHLINPGRLANLNSILNVPATHGSRGPSPSRGPLQVSSSRTNPGVIAICPTQRRGAPAPLSQDPPQPELLPPPPTSSILDIFRSRPPAGLYRHEHRPDRHSLPGAGGHGSQNPHHSPGFPSPHLPIQTFQIPTSSAMGRHHGMPHDDQQPGSSRSSSSGSRHQGRSGARPKTKAIRSSQVPQSARYTAQEVDMMVEQVANYPGNLVPCAVCQKQVKRERLRAHIHECHLLHGKRIICPHCGIGLKSKGSFRVHIWRHKRGALPGSKPNSRCTTEAAPGSQQEMLQELDEQEQRLEEMHMQQFDHSIDVSDDSDDDEEYPNGEAED